jgi:D-alanyl-D-alanine dipeptidase
MYRKISYIILFSLVLAGCGKTSDKQEIQTSTKELQTDTSIEESMTQNSEIPSDSNTNQEEQESKSNEISTADQDNIDQNAQNEENEENNKRQTMNSNSEELQNESIAKKYNLPEGFVYVDDVIPTVEFEIRYYTDYNFVGEKIDGYIAPLAILTTQAADALKAASDMLSEDGYHIKVYDAYRPQKAVNHFVRWAQTDDASMKEVFYPSMEKQVLFSDGYISKKSRHSRGSTVDITIMDEDNHEIDMGGYFDLLDTVSNYDTNQITESQHTNREYLRSIMDKAGFDSIRTEWWHFQLRQEPYPDTYFDFDIE